MAPLGVWGEINTADQAPLLPGWLSDSGRFYRSATAEQREFVAQDQGCDEAKPESRLAERSRNPHWMSVFLLL
jgi:hypothetical protein